MTRNQRIVAMFGVMFGSIIAVKLGLATVHWAVGVQTGAILGALIWTSKK